MREFKMKRLFHLAVALAALVLVTTPARADSDFYTENEILNAARGFFGETTGGLAKAVQKVFSDLGEPNGYILGEEVGGAFIVGLRSREKRRQTQSLLAGTVGRFRFRGQRGEIDDARL